MASGNCNILLIENWSVIRETIAGILNSSVDNTFDIVSASNITDGVGVLSDVTKQFDIVITSLSLPDSFGLLSIMAIKEVEERMPIIVLNDIGDDIREDAINYGATECIEKTKTALREQLIDVVNDIYN